VRVSSLGNSGGGLADYSVFSDEKVYTVYLDMRKTLDDPAPSWTLQYAVLRPPNDPSPTSELTPPFPATKEIPKLSPEVLVRYSGRVVVVYGIIDSQGKFQELTVKDSPDDQLDVPIIVALRKWSFRPAELNGQPIAIKVLLGITLSPE